jgi:hypothetical protein
MGNRGILSRAARYLADIILPFQLSVFLWRAAPDHLSWDSLTASSLSSTQMYKTLTSKLRRCAKHNSSQ